MKKNFFLFILILQSVLLENFIFAQNKALFCFYNVENLYDTLDDPKFNDNEFLPTSKKLWNTEKYNKKIENISFVIKDIGEKKINGLPDIVGLCEVENEMVLKDLANNPYIKNANYKSIIFDSKYERGVDVALMYKPKAFKVLNTKVYELKFPFDSTKFTRDILLVTGILYTDTINIIVNHWPSRRGGLKETEPYRLHAAKVCRKIVDSILSLDSLALIVIIGDFNDDPNNKSIKKVLKATGKKELASKTKLYNATYFLFRKGIGSLAYQDKWNMFDQVIVSYGLLKNSHKKLRFLKAGIFNAEYLQIQDGKFKGYPFRTYVGNFYQGGFSDHFPSYCIIEIIK